MDTGWAWLSERWPIATMIPVAVPSLMRTAAEGLGDLVLSHGFFTRINFL